MNGLRSAFALTAMGVVALGNTACIRDTDCGICDPDNLVLESISGLNYASKKVHLLGPPCEGTDCPGQVKKGSYFVEEIGPCEDTMEAKTSSRPDEYCKISPLVVTYGIEFVFNNLLDPATVELVRKRPDQPKLFEVYDWKTKILDIVGPTTRYNGDFIKGPADIPDEITRLVNLSCIDNLRDDNQSYGAEDRLDWKSDPCNQTHEVMVDGERRQVPLKTRVGTPDAKLQSFRGIWTQGSNSCDTPQEGYDSCCTECDYVLATKVAKYGLDENGEARNPNDNTAITCDAMDGDPLVECRNFIPSVDRSQEDYHYTYFWCDPKAPGCERETFSVPWSDKIRETHPDERPAHLENFDAKCETTADCSDPHNLPGTICVGEKDGAACLMDADENCQGGVCRAQWMATCRANPDTTGGEQGYCVDRRFADAGAGACFLADERFEGQCNDEGGDCNTYKKNTQLGACNSTANDTVFSAAECCQESLGAASDGAACDPFYQSNVRPVPRYIRNDKLPEVTRDCICEDNPSDKCVDVVNASCRDENGDIRDDRRGEFAVLFVERRGGVVYDPAIKGVEWRPADLGGIPRADAERCAEDRGLVAPRNRHEGWRANDAFLGENFEDYDRAMCSSSTYTVTFATPEDGAGTEFIKDKVGNTLEGKSKYTFDTVDFHVIPGSGFPTDNLRIGACDSFAITFSNKYDMSPENQRKLQLFRVDTKGTVDVEDDELVAPEGCTPDDPSNPPPLAGGPNCVNSKAELDPDGDGTEDPCLAPCLTVDVTDQSAGTIRASIDPTEFGARLEKNLTYRLVVPGLGELDQMGETAAYQSAFWDACGMPLVTGGYASGMTPDYLYQFTVDEPKCKEDQDQDDVQFSCDNAPDFFNPNQEDTDGDGTGDVIDLCPILAGTANSADSDKDGVGNECDSCRQAVKQYNMHDAGVAVPDYMMVRNIPAQADTDDDGIGDVCDNCVQASNCESYGLINFGAPTDNPYGLGDPILYDDQNKCQRDDAGGRNMVGDACEGQMLDGAAGPVGLGAQDDFDQDGLVNMVDACPRQPVAPISCTTDAECGTARCGPAGVCNHPDEDGDGIGDACDNCYEANPMQIVEGAMQEDDADADFVGIACETNPDCAIRADPRPFAFYEIAVGGQCCTAALIEDENGNLINATTKRPLLDPDDRPISVDCVEAENPLDNTCRKLPDKVAATPGVLTPPPGCQDALDAAGLTATTNPLLTPGDFPSVDAMWNSLCFLPQFDQDYDGYGDPCDLCPYDFDPMNLQFIDGNGRVWPMDGRYCNGDYSIERKCEGEDTAGETGASESGGSAGDTGMGTGGGGSSGG